MEVTRVAGSGGRLAAFPIPNGAEWPFPERRVRRRRLSRFVSGRCRKIPRRAADSANRMAAVGTGRARARGRQMLSPPSEGRPRRTIGRAPVGKARTIGDDPVAHAAARMPDATGRCHPLAEPPKGRGKRPFAHRDPAHPAVWIMPGRAGIRHRLGLRTHHTSYWTRCGHAHEGRGTQFPRWRTWDTRGAGPSANTPDADDAAFSCRRAAPSRRRQRFRRRPGNPRLGPPADSAIDPRTVPRTASCR